MQNNDKLKELSNIIENARKYSIVGEYGNSLENYQQAISIIKERQQEIINESEDLKEKWKMTEYNIKSEMLQIKDVLETCLILHHSHFNYAKKQLEGNEYINENKKILEKEIMELYNKDKKINEKSNNNNKSNSYSNKVNKKKNKIGKTNMNFIIDIKREKKPKINPWLNNKKYINKNNKSNSNNENSFNIKKSRSLKVNNMEKKMFNPLEEFYGKKSENSKENKINGKDFHSLSRKSEIIQQKINMQNISSSNNIKSNTKNVPKNIQNNLNNDNKKKIKVIEIDLDDAIGKKISNENKIDENNEENIDIVDQVLKNLSQLNIDNNDDSF